MYVYVCMYVVNINFQNMTLMCVFVRIKEWLNSFWKKLVSKYSANFNGLQVLRL